MVLDFRIVVEPFEKFRMKRNRRKHKKEVEWHYLQSLGPIDGTQWTQHAENSQDLDYGYRSGAKTEWKVAISVKNVLTLIVAGLLTERRVTPGIHKPPASRGD